MAFKQYDKVKLKDGAVGYLIEDFEDGWYLFEYETPDDPHAYADKEIELDDIESETQ